MIYKAPTSIKNQDHVVKVTNTVNSGFVKNLYKKYEIH